MESPELNRNLEETQELHQRWSQFHDFFAMSMKSQKITAQAEMKFLELKTRIAMLHDGFMQSLQHDQKVGQNVMSILASCILLRRLPLMSAAEIQKLEFDWNECYLLMTETIANLEEEKEALGEVSERSYKLGQIQARVSATVHNFFTGPIFKFSVIVGGTLGVVVGIPMFTSFSYMEVKKKWPMTAFVYAPVMSLARGIYGDLPYIEFDDIKKGELETKYQHNRNDANQLSYMSPDEFKTKLRARGFDESDWDDVNEIIDRRLAFEKEIIRGPRRGEKLFAYYFLLKNANDARQFINLRQRGLEKLPEGHTILAEQSKLMIGRKGNLVLVLQEGTEDMRHEIATVKWLLEGNEIDL